MAEIQPTTLDALEQACRLAGAQAQLDRIELALHDLVVIRQDIPAVTRRARRQKQGELNGLDLVRQLLKTERRVLKNELGKQQKESSVRRTVTQRGQLPQ